MVKFTSGQLYKRPRAEPLWVTPPKPQNSHKKPHGNPINPQKTLQNPLFPPETPRLPRPKKIEKKPLK
jgi:hypothetical protein